MKNDDGVTIYTLNNQLNGMIPASGVDLLFVSPGSMPHNIFVEAAELFGAVYHEIEAVPLSPKSRRWLWRRETTVDSSSLMVTFIQIVYL